MTSIRILPTLAAGLALVAAVSVGVLAGEGTTRDAAPSPIQSPFLRSLVGEWTTDVVDATRGGGTGQVSWRLGPGETTIYFDRLCRMSAAAEPHGWNAHVVLRSAEDPAKVEAWLFDDSRRAPQAYVGTVREDGFELTSVGGPESVRVTCTRSGRQAVVVVSKEGKEVFRETCTPAKGGA